MTREAVNLDNNERCHVDLGMSTYEAVLPNEISDIYAEMWLPDHSLELVNLLNTQKGVTLIGEVGSGKSALLYGARTIMRSQGMPYAYINGHFKETPAEDVIRIIDEAEQKEMKLVYDSADYLAAGKKKVRSLPLVQHIPRNLTIMERLMRYRQDGGTLLMTSHHQDWIDDFAHPELLPVWNQLVDHTVQQEVQINLPEYDQRIRLLGKIGMNPDAAEFIAQLPESPAFIDYIAHKWGDKKYIDWAQQQLTQYSMLKLLVRDNYGAHEPVLNTINEMFQNNEAPEASFDCVLDFIFSKTYVLSFFSRL